MIETTWLGGALYWAGHRVGEMVAEGTAWRARVWVPSSTSPVLDQVVGSRPAARRWIETQAITMLTLRGYVVTEVLA